MGEIMKTLVGFLSGIIEVCDELAGVIEEFVKTSVEFTLVVIELFDERHGAMNVCSELLENVEFVRSWTVEILLNCSRKRVSLASLPLNACTFGPLLFSLSKTYCTAAKNMSRVNRPHCGQKLEP
jgi:hypothetical protein